MTIYLLLQYDLIITLNMPVKQFFAPTNLNSFSMENDPDPACASEDTTILQCRTARRVARTSDTVDISPGPDCGLLSSAPLPTVGELTREDDFCFRGARKTYQGTIVNQNIGCSFDPSNMMCLACRSEHNIVNLDRPVVIALSDQNFVPAITGGDENVCIPVVRLEDASLNDITTMAFEILDNTKVDSNFILLLGSATHLACVGTAAYAVDWTKSVQRLKGKWPDALLLPLFPIPTADCKIGLAREITELATWFEKMYRSTPYGLTSAWAAAVRTYNAASVGVQQLNSPETYTMSLPSSLFFPSPAQSVRFVSKSARPAGTVAFDRKASCELIRCLLVNLNADLHTGFVLGGDLLKDPGKLFVEVAKEPLS